MAFRAGQHNFSKGVLSKELLGRSDIVPYNAAVRQGTNVLILKYGGLTKRPGTRFVYDVRDGVPKKLFPFEGAYGASYAMLVGQATMRLAAGGGMVIEEKLTIEEFYLENPLRIKASFHGLTTGDEVYFSEVTGPWQINGRILRATVLGPDYFTVQVDATTWAAMTADAGGIIRVGAPPAPPPAPPVPVPGSSPPPPEVGGPPGGNIQNGPGYSWGDDGYGAIP